MNHVWPIHTRCYCIFCNFHNCAYISENANWYDLIIIYVLCISFNLFSFFDFLVYYVCGLVNKVYQNENVGIANTLNTIESIPVNSSKDKADDSSHNMGILDLINSNKLDTYAASQVANSQFSYFVFFIHFFFQNWNQ